MAKRKTTDPPSTPVTFEDSLAELQTIVSELEDGSLGLETSLARFERGVGLLRSCYAILESAEQRVQILTRFTREGQAMTAPLEMTAALETAASVEQVDIISMDHAAELAPFESDKTSHGSTADKPSLF